MEDLKESKEKQDIILLILNCYKYKKKALFQKNTWLKNLPKNIKYYHILANENIKENYIFNDEENILIVSCPDDYCNLPKKVIRAYEAIYQRYDFKYIYKTDDDQMLINPNFFNNIAGILKDQENRIHYGGNIITLKMPQVSMYHKIHNELPSTIVLKPTKYSNGRFYFLSIHAVKQLIKNKNNIDKEYIEDYAIGYHLDHKLKEYILLLVTDAYFRDIDNLPEYVNM